MAGRRGVLDKKRCRLNEADIQMVKELGMTPKGVFKNIPAPNQQWKALVKVWIRDMYEKKFGRLLPVKPAFNEGTNSLKNNSMVVHKTE